MPALRWLTLSEAYAIPPRVYAWSARNFPHLAQSFTSEHTSLSQPHKRVYIVGVGNLGRLFAMSLAKSPAKPPITLVVHRKELLEEWIRRPGIEILRGNSVVNSRNFAVEWWSEEKPKEGPVVEVANGKTLSNIIVSTKTASALREVDRMRRYLSAESTLAFAQNGMSRLWPPSGDAYMTSRFGTKAQGPNCLAMVTKHGVTSLGPFRSKHASEADVAMGPVWLNETTGGKSQYLTDLLLAASKLEARELARDDLWIYQLEKLVVNSVINPTTAILRVKNGEVFADPLGPVGRVVDRLIREASQIILALIQSEVGHGILGMTGATDLALLERFSFGNLRTMIYHLCGVVVKDNVSSMLQDIKAGKETEIDDLNGWLLGTAEFLGLRDSVPTHKAIIKLVEEAATVTPEDIEDRLASKHQS
ncbi:putative 2-dehydropantoate 2-reductase [Ceratocystis fimbriata CBS 114723]|uniref:Putative 2-dehydropantoate 2-reductase n=1 Tax=Ceratocystis fimbriata CBS 114723 TaxID=1035309 RepID=A0A2C5X528_9PEZI|nr:putative 2-dehydropantoate 2-reductase [Ceratocystis fimbriata CBS 114723]